ncbi:uncharacterized protein Dmoj_GI26911 [Drosophila mojavensis]|uniref:Uncharacterized protein n=1 Tax=Drosophila mojavensis TaxID=7230 RepID=A0A0Q9XD01_DROMO|nr:uncharacterized protein Dmoj_GI26911 [Drosophila mojavensis]
MAPPRGPSSPRSPRSLTHVRSKVVGSQTENLRDLFEMIYCSDNRETNDEDLKLINESFDLYMSTDKDFNQVETAELHPVRVFIQEPRSKICSYLYVLMGFTLFTGFFSWLADIQR